MPTTLYTWSATPQDNNFDNPNNWLEGSSEGYPGSIFATGQSNIVFFGTSSITSLTFSSNVTNIGSIDLRFSSNASAYSFTLPTSQSGYRCRPRVGWN